MDTAVVVNQTLFVPSLNGSLININDCKLGVCSMKWAEIRYIPSAAGNGIYAAIFGILLLSHLGLGAFYRTWGFMIGMFGGLVLELIGYIERLEMHDNPFLFGPFVTSLVCLTIAPAFMSAAIYTCISRMVVVYGRNIGRFHPRTYTITFICCDIFSLVLQAAGGAMAASGNSNSPSKKNGVNVMIAGLSFQVVSLLLFLIVSIDLLIAAARASPTQLDQRFAQLRSTRSFRFFAPATIVATTFIFIRCAFRVAELQAGFGGSIANNQALFMVFEGPMIMLAIITLTIFHPGRCFGGRQGWRDANWTWKSKPRVDNDSIHFENWQTKNEEPSP